MYSPGTALRLSQSSSNEESKPSLSEPMKKFYLGEPLALGITQIMIGMMNIAFGVVLDIQGKAYDYYMMETPHWSGILYIISGSLSVAAARNPKMSLVKGMLGMNVVSAVAAAIAIIIISFSLIFGRRPMHWYAMELCEPGKDAQLCWGYEMSILRTVIGLEAILMAFSILEFCIAISASAFGCKTVCRNSYTDTIVVVYQNVTSENTVPEVAPEVP